MYEVPEKVDPVSPVVKEAWNNQIKTQLDTDTLPQLIRVAAGIYLIAPSQITESFPGAVIFSSA